MLRTGSALLGFDPVFVWALRAVTPQPGNSWYGPDLVLGRRCDYSDEEWNDMPYCPEDIDAAKIEEIDLSDSEN
jgi:hypothetical protein